MALTDSAASADTKVHSLGCLASARELAREVVADTVAGAADHTVAVRENRRYYAVVYAVAAEPDWVQSMMAGAYANDPGNMAEPAALAVAAKADGQAAYLNARAVREDRLDAARNLADIGEGRRAAVLPLQMTRSASGSVVVAGPAALSSDEEAESDQVRVEDTKAAAGPLGGLARRTIERVDVVHHTQLAPGPG